MPPNRGYVGGKFALELGDESPFAGWLYSAEGGQYYSEVVQEKLGPSEIVNKHIGGVKYEPITISCGAGMSNAFDKWIEKSLAHDYQRKNGAILTCDYDHNLMSSIHFYEALLTEIGFPGVDANSKDPAKMTLKFQPERCVWKKEPGNQKIVAGGSSGAPINTGIQKLWTMRDFKFQVDGALEPTDKIAKIEPITIKQSTVDHYIGNMRDAFVEPGHLEYPNLTFSMSESHADKMMKWAEDFIQSGNCGQEHEKSAHLVMYASDLKTEILTLDFANVGVFKYTPDKLEAGGEQVRRIKFECYVERIDATFKKKWA